MTRCKHKRIPSKTCCEHNVICLGDVMCLITVSLWGKQNIRNVGRMLGIPFLLSTHHSTCASMKETIVSEFNKITAWCDLDTSTCHNIGRQAHQDEFALHRKHICLKEKYLIFINTDLVF